MMTMLNAAPTIETASSDLSCLLTEPQLVERILALNPSATEEYLQGFDRNALSIYLRHLLAALEPRGRQARWVRPGDTPAIVRAAPRADA